MSPVLPREERDAIRARAEAATPGPWSAYGTAIAAYFEPNCGGCSGIVSPAHEPSCGIEQIAQADAADADFIAHARSDVPALLDALDAAEAKDIRRADAIRDALAELRRAEAECDAARAEVAALRGRIGHIVDRYGDAHDAKDCAVLHDLRALAADEGERTGR